MYPRYVLERGLITCYDDDKTPAQLLFQTHHIALAFDSEALSLLRVGESSEVMAWASTYRAGLREQRNFRRADEVSVVQLHGEHSVVELTKLGRDPLYLQRFLQNAKLI